MPQEQILDFIKQLATDESIKRQLLGSLDDIDLGNLLKMASENGLNIAPDELKSVLEIYQKLDDSPIGGIIDKLF